MKGDKKKKLKPDAVPTIFSFTKETSKRKTSVNREEVAKKEQVSSIKTSFGEREACISFWKFVK